MNIIKKMVVLVKQVFTRKKDVKALEAPKHVVNQEQRANFTDSLKVTTSKTKKKIETLTCQGDGLGIQKKISY